MTLGRNGRRRELRIVNRRELDLRAKVASHYTQISRWLIDRRWEHARLQSQSLTCSWQVPYSK